jgi:hypothetical protein
MRQALILRAGAFALSLFIAGCAVSVEHVGSPGNFIGYSDGEYVRLYYRVEDSVLTLAVENTSILPLYQVVFSVEQKTSAGSTEGQSSLRILRKAQVHSMNLNIPANATGEVVFTCYFEQAAPDASIAQKEYFDDRILLQLGGGGYK